jgi:hypothetical protein
MKHARTQRNRRQSALDEILSLPDYQNALATSKRIAHEKDIATLSHLITRLDGRRPHKLPPRCQRFHSTIYRDPIDLVSRYLRRFTCGPWHRGGSHVARFHGGPGIGFRNFRNDRRISYQPIPIRH